MKSSQSAIKSNLGAARSHNYLHQDTVSQYSACSSSYMRGKLVCRLFKQQDHRLSVGALSHKPKIRSPLG